MPAGPPPTTSTVRELSLTPVMVSSRSRPVLGFIAQRTPSRMKIWLMQR
jgi:hypothetical protein